MSILATRCYRAFCDACSAYYAESDDLAYSCFDSRQEAEACLADERWEHRKGRWLCPTCAGHETAS